MAIFPDVLGNLTSLEVLDLSNNQLSDLISRTCKYLNLLCKTLLIVKILFYNLHALSRHLRGYENAG